MLNSLLTLTVVDYLGFSKHPVILHMNNGNCFLIKISTDGFNNRMVRTKERISKLENITRKITQPEQQRDKKNEKIDRA